MKPKSLTEAYMRIYLKEDEDFRDQMPTSKKVYDKHPLEEEDEIPPVEGEEEDWGVGPDDSLPPATSADSDDTDELEEKKQKMSIKPLPTQAEIVASKRAPIHKPTQAIKPKKGIYNRQKFKRDDY
jgi:hypothetical protein